MCLNTDIRMKSKVRKLTFEDNATLDLVYCHIRTGKLNDSSKSSIR